MIKFSNESEKELLLTLSRHMAAIKDKQELLSVLNTHVRKVFPFSHSNIVRLDHNKKTFSAFLTDPQSAAKKHPGYLSLTTTDFSIKDDLLQRILYSDASYVFNIADAAINDRLPDYLKPIHESGLLEMVSISLQVEGTAFGILTFFSDKHGQFDDYLDIIMGIASQVSVAVSNIVAYEIIHSQEKEQRTLLHLSKKMAKIRDKSELLSAISTELKNIFYFTHSTISLVSDDRSYFTIYMVDPLLLENIPTKYLEHIQARYPIPDGVYEHFLRSEGAYINLYEDLLNMQDPPIYANVHYKTGIREAVSIPMFKDKEVWAVLHFFSDITGIFSRHLPVINAIAGQVSIAMANAIANEDIQKREQEKEMLLSLSYEIARVRDQDKLLEVINTTLRGMLYFTHTSVQVIDWKTETFNIFITDPKSRSRRHPAFEEMVATAWPIHDGVFNELIQSDNVTITDFEQEVLKINAPSYVKLHYAVGLKEAASIALYGENEEIFGVLTFFSDKKGMFTTAYQKTLTSIANQISIAVANIIAHQEIREREREKETLLGISNDLASIRGLRDLQKTLTKKLREIFDFDRFLICLFDHEHVGTQVLLSEIEETSPITDKLKNLTKSDIKRIDELMNKLTDATFNLDQHDANIAFLSLLKKDNYKQALFVRLPSGINTLGFLCLLSVNPNQFKKDQLPMLKGIADQVAIAINNVLANERIIKQLEEINNYKQQLEQENLYLQQEIDTVYNYSEMIGSGKETQKVYRLISQVAPTYSTVLITGETGTGKELVARAIHDSSPRSKKLMIKVNCAALPAHLVESELFGHERGSFTGATERRIGKFELANKSTLFLDEIGELSPELQVKLLRALQEKEIERIGGQSTIPVDVRIIAATNRDLQKEVLEGRFRSDLFYRLNVFPIHLPPLRERLEDVPALTMFFINRFARTNANRHISGVSTKVMDQMVAYQWPGNVRELEHLIERSILLSEGNMIKTILLPGKKNRTENPDLSKQKFTPKSMRQMEREYILKVLEHCNGKVQGHGGAAELLEMPATTLHSKMKKLGIRKKHFPPFT